MKVAIIHDWLVSYGGAERVLEVLHELFPDAPVFTSVYDGKKLPKSLSGLDVRTSFIQKFPFAKKLYRNYLPFMPAAFEQFDLRGFDVVISNSHACAKGVITPISACHICYCLSPMRYAWDMYNEYLEIEKVGWFSRKIIPWIMSRLRIWDAVSANRVDSFIGISNHVRNRIKKFYRRDADVIYPPVETGKFKPADKEHDYYLVVSRLVPQKRVDIIVEAFNELGLPLKVAGSGRDLQRLKKIAKGNIEFLGYQSDGAVIDLISKCKAFVFASYEDFGIVPLEAQSTGRPAIVYGAGGALETVIPDKTGVIFEDQTAASIIKAVKRFETMKFDPKEIRQFALGFDREIFKQKLMASVNEKYEEYQKNRLAK